MVDFKKRLNKTEIEKKINPIEIYSTLDRRSIAGPLRPAQYKILKEWYEKRLNDRDLIIKLHTGEGKTLIGLLILLSKINSDKGPCLYVCPNNYLVHQVKRDARKFGIPYCSIEEDGSLPNDFLKGNKILIVHVQKVFNGRTAFGIGNDYIDVNTVILDDSHACIDSIKDSFTISLKKNHNIYKKLFHLFSDSLPEQGHGTFLEIENGDYNSFLPIPYWTWIDKTDDVLQIISDSRDDKEIKFAWPFIKDNIQNCQSFISGQILEISPIHIPIEKFSSFFKAEQRILMSATTQDDSFFIKGLGLDINAVKTPLENSEQKWSGEKMLLIPSLIHETLDYSTIINNLIPPSNKNYGIVSLVSSFSKTEVYKDLGALSPITSELESVIENLKKGNFEDSIVFANRYDGIDLADEVCRILIIDGKPYFYSLADRYEESNRINSDLVNIKVAQKIEQGLGRSVRGEKDYSIIIIIGGDLVKFIKSSRTNKYFSSQTKKQIDIGFDIAQMAIEDISDKTKPMDALKSLMKQSLQRDEGWKEFYVAEMNSIDKTFENSSIYEILVLERDAYFAGYTGNYEKACEKIQKIIDDFCIDESEKGWYLQIKARYQYFTSKIESNNLQKSAFFKNHELLKPKEGITYKKINFINEDRINRIKNYIANFDNYQDLMISLEGVLSDLEFGTNSEKFESALRELGIMLGFLSERPDKEFKTGPDNLWCGVGNKYFIFECKSEVDPGRLEINKSEASQMNSHCGWFQEIYNDADVNRILIIPTKNLAFNANFTHDVKILRKGKLRSLRNNVKSFFKEFSNYELQSLTDLKINSFLDSHRLDLNSLWLEYSEPFYRKK
ncbi:DEAD/DEAH box helicase [Elizabethkingia ursingii]|nr:DEAD/DEAH box helicase family protein [Elizabethkingia anophelis]